MDVKEIKTNKDIVKWVMELPPELKTHALNYLRSGEIKGDPNLTTKDKVRLIQDNVADRIDRAYDKADDRQRGLLDKHVDEWFSALGTSSPDKPLEYSTLVENKIVDPHTSVDKIPESVISRQARYWHVTREDARKAIKNAARREHDKIVEESKAALPEQLKEARLKALNSNDGMLDKAANVVSRFTFPRTYETMENGIKAGDSPSISPWAMAGDLVDMAANATPVPFKGKIATLGLKQGKRALGLLANLGAGAAKDAAMTAGAEVVADQDPNYEFNGWNVAGSGIGSFGIPAATGGVTSVLNRFAVTRKAAEAIEKASKSVESLPQMERMKYDSARKSLIGNYKELKELATKANELDKAYAEAAKRGDKATMAKLDKETYKLNKQITEKALKLEDEATNFNETYPSVTKPTQSEEMVMQGIKDVNAKFGLDKPRPVYVLKDGEVVDVSKYDASTMAKIDAPASAKENARRRHEGIESDKAEEEAIKKRDASERNKLFTPVRDPYNPYSKLSGANSSYPIETNTPIGYTTADVLAKRLNSDADVLAKRSSEGTLTWNATPAERRIAGETYTNPNWASAVVNTIIGPFSRLGSERGTSYEFDDKDEDGNSKRNEETIKKRKEAKKRDEEERKKLDELRNSPFIFGTSSPFYFGDMNERD